MKLAFLGMLTAGVLGANSLCAADRDISFKIEKKKLAAEKSESYSTVKKVESWGYKVQIQNKSFRDLKDIKVEYVVFLNDAQRSRGSEKVLKKEKGSKEIGAILNNKLAEFETEPVDLTKTQLKGDWISFEGRARVTDSLEGIWLKVYEGEEVFAEYCNPATLKRTEKFTN